MFNLKKCKSKYNQYRSWPLDTIDWRDIVGYDAGGLIIKNDEWGIDITNRSGGWACNNTIPIDDFIGNHTDEIVSFQHDIYNLISRDPELRLLYFNDPTFTKAIRCAIDNGMNIQDTLIFLIKTGYKVKDEMMNSYLKYLNQSTVTSNDYVKSVNQNTIISNDFGGSK